MLIDLNQFFQNVSAALDNQQDQLARFLLHMAVQLANLDTPVTVSTPLGVSLGLDRGRRRRANEDGVLAVTGVVPGVQHFGLFVVCDGMGGHAHGQEASALALQTILESVLGSLKATITPLCYEHVLAESIQQANRAIYERNGALEQQVTQLVVGDSRQRDMGTTVTAVLLVDEIAYVANVGDSRTYLYDRALRRITQDHSLVARYQAQGLLQEEEVYTHPLRNQITRSLGAKPVVQVDLFVVPLHGHETFLLCSDGTWEMMRDCHIEAVLSAPNASAEAMTTQLVQLANDGGGTDNIGCIVVQLQRRAEVSAMEMTRVEPSPSEACVASAPQTAGSL